MHIRGLAGHWTLGLDIGGHSIPADPSNTEYIFIIETIHQSLPSIEIQFKDNSNTLLDSARIGEGTPIDIVLTNREAGGDMTPLRFVMESAPGAIAAGGSMKVNIKGVLNALAWKRKVVDKSYRGTSSSVISRLAGEAGLRAETHGTGDSQAWLPTGKPLAQFAEFVSQRGWAGNSSAMQIAVTAKHKLKYYDVNRLIGMKAGKIFASNAAIGTASIPVLQWTAQPKQGMANNAYAMGATTRVVMPSGQLKELGKVAVGMLSGALGFSAGSAASLGSVGGRLGQLAIDGGNVHKKFYEAFHQNSRIKSTYALDITVMTDKPSHSELLDVVRFEPREYGGGQAVNQFTGNYIITTKTTCLYGTRYFERLTLTSQGGS